MIAVYAGSFDPITKGHKDVITRASQAFEKVIVGIGVNSSKTPMLDVGSRKALIAAVCSDLPNVVVDSFEGLLVHFAESVGARILVRGLRAVTDFDYEIGIANANAQLVPTIDTFFVATKPEFSFVSSSTVREIAKHGGDVSYYVDPIVQQALHKVYADAYRYPKG